MGVLLAGEIGKCHRVPSFMRRYMIPTKALAVFFIVTVVPNAGSGFPPAAGPILYYMSVGITAIASGLIIYRIMNVTKQCGGVAGRYTYTIEVIVESGALYLITLLIASVLLSEANAESVYSESLVGSWMYFNRASIPITVRVSSFSHLQQRNTECMCTGYCADSYSASRGNRQCETFVRLVTATVWHPI